MQASAGERLIMDSEKDSETIGRERAPVWRHSRYICALSDAHRHLGHIVYIAGQWHAYDATHLNGERNGYKELGVYNNPALAKAAVEGSCAKDEGHLAMSASAGGMWIS